MSTLELVDPALRELALNFPILDPARGSVAEYRNFTTEAHAQMFPGDAEKPTVFHVAGKGSPDVRLLVFRPANRPEPLPAIFFIHGGGFIAGSPDILKTPCQRLADEHGAVVVSVAYRLAPETCFPGPLEDCYAGLDWVFRNAATVGVDAGRIIVMGASAGGGLTAALALLTRDRGEHRLVGQVLIYPMLDSRTGTPDAPTTNPTTGEFVWKAVSNHFGWSSMRGDAAIPDERIGHFSPSLAADLSGLPSTFIGVGSLDLFLDENVEYAMRLSRAGVPIDLHVYPGGIHGFDFAPSGIAGSFAVELKRAVSAFLSNHSLEGAVA
jgi:acetyl esterase/lipase